MSGERVALAPLGTVAPITMTAAQAIPASTQCSRRHEAGAAETEFTLYGGIVAGGCPGIVRIYPVRSAEGKAPDARLNDRLRAASMRREKPQADYVTGECELDDITASVPAGREEADHAPFDPEEIRLGIARLKQDLIALEHADGCIRFELRWRPRAPSKISQCDRLAHS